MSQTKRMHVVCSYCGKKLSITAYPSLNNHYSDTVEDDVISGKLFKTHCSRCAHISTLEYDTLYQDIERGVLIQVLHKQNPEYGSTLLNLRKHTPKGLYSKTRIVNTVKELGDKVACLKMNRDDRIIELCKLMLLDELEKLHPEFESREITYILTDGKEQICFHNGVDYAYSYDLDEEMYERLKEYYYSSPIVYPEDNFPIVNIKWAEFFFNEYSRIAENNKANDAESETSEKAETPKKQENVLEIEEKREVKNTPLDESERSKQLDETHKYCRKCGTALPLDSVFCHMCGQKWETVGGNTNSRFETRQLISKMVLAVCNSVDKLQQENDKSYLMINPFTQLDSIIIAYFIFVRLFSEKAEQQKLPQRETLIKEVLASLKQNVSYKILKDDVIVSQAFDNRLSLYSKLFEETDNSDKMNFIMEEFEFILKSDIMLSKYLPCEENTTLPVLGMGADESCHQEIQRFINETQKTFSDEIDDFFKDFEKIIIEV